MHSNTGLLMLLVRLSKTHSYHISTKSHNGMKTTAQSGRRYWPNIMEQSKWHVKGNVEYRSGVLAKVHRATEEDSAL